MAFTVAENALVGQAFADTSTTAKHSVGHVAKAKDPTLGSAEFVYVKATSAISQYDVVTYDETCSTTVAPLSTSNDARGDRVGVAPVAIASGSYGWLQISGACTMNVLASCAANTRLNTTATAGSLDDDGTVGAMQVQGLYLTAARGGTNGSAAGILNRPWIDATL